MLREYQQRTPEQQKASTEKSIATRKANSAIRKIELRDAYERKHLLKDQIEKLESKLTVLKQIDLMNEIANKVSGNTLLREHEIVSVSKPWQQFVGVYFLIDNGKIVYVGQSVNVYSRISQHSKKFDSFSILPCQKNELDALESLYIHVLKPPLNSNDTNTFAPMSMQKLMQYIKDSPQRKSYAP
jgi:hypothetical protein